MKTNEAKAQMTVWWVLWAAFQIAIFIYYHFLGNTGVQPRPQRVDSFIWLAGFAPLTISAIVRWLVLPRTRDAQSALPLFIVGIAMAEATCFLGLFIFPAHRQELFIWSAIGVFQFIPYFVPRYFARDDQRLNG